MKTCLIFVGALAAAAFAVFLICVLLSLVFGLLFTLRMLPGSGRRAFVEAARNIRRVEQELPATQQYPFHHHLRLARKIGKCAWITGMILVVVLIGMTLAEVILR